MNKIEDTPKGLLTSKVKLIAVGFLAAIVAGAVLYAFGWWQGSKSVDSGEEEINKINQELQVSQQQVNLLQNRSYLMQARAALFESAVDLDQRNFGMANVRLQEAANALGQVKDGQNKLDVVKLGELRQKIAQTNINVAVNLEAQRQKILSFVRELNGLIPEEFKQVSTEKNQ